MPSKKKPPKPSAEELGLLQQQKDVLAQQQASLAKAEARAQALAEAQSQILALPQATITKPPPPSEAEVRADETQRLYDERLQKALREDIPLVKPPKTEAEIRADETQRLYDERLQRALGGDVPLDPTTEREIAEDRSALETGLTRALGPNFIASTPGQMAISRFNEDVAGRRFRNREGFIAGAEAPSYNRYSLGQNLAQQQFQNREALIAGTEAPSFNRYSLGQNLAQQRFERPLQVSQAYGSALSTVNPLSQAYGGASSDINAPLSYYTNERYLPWQAGEQRRAETLRGLGQLAGAGASFYTGGFAMPKAIRSLGSNYGSSLPAMSPYILGNPPNTYNLG